MSIIINKNHWLCKSLINYIYDNKILHYSVPNKKYIRKVCILNFGGNFHWIDITITLENKYGSLVYYIYPISKYLLKALIIIKRFVQKWKNKHLTLKKICNNLIINNQIEYTIENIPTDLKLYILKQKMKDDNYHFSQKLCKIFNNKLRKKYHCKRTKKINMIIVKNLFEIYYLQKIKIKSTRKYHYFYLE